MLLQMIAAALSEPLGSPSVVSLTDDTSTGRKGGTAGFMFGDNGAVYRYVNDVPIVVAYWIAPQTGMSDYEIRATLSSGSTPDSGTIGSWEALSTARFWELTNPTPPATNIITSALLIEIRWTGNNVVQDSATFTLSAQGPVA